MTELTTTNLITAVFYLVMAVLAIGIGVVSISIAALVGIVGFWVWYRRDKANE